MNNYDTSSPFGTVTLAQAMQNSINSVFCNIGKALGGLRIVDKMKRFGFYSVPPLETPVNERAISGLYNSRASSSTRRTRARSTRAGSRSARGRRRVSPG